MPEDRWTPATLAEHEEPLAKREDLLRLVIEGFPAVLWSTDRELRFTSSFGGGLKALGLRAGQVVGTTLREFFGTDDPEFPTVAAHRRALEGESVSYEQRWAERNYRVQVAPLYEGERVVGTVGIAHDITDVRLAREALRRRDAILQAVSFSAEQFLRVSSWQECITNVVQRLGEAAEVSRVYLFENHLDDAGNPVTSHRAEWAAPGIFPETGDPKLQAIPLYGAGFDRWTETLSRGELICGHVRKFPSPEREFLTGQGVVSILAVPIHLGGEPWGFIGFDECVAEREWSEAEIDALRAAAGIFAAAVQRTRAKQALLEAHQQLERRVEERTAELAEANRRLEAEIDQHRRTEQQLRRSEERFRQLAENLHQVFYLNDAERILYVNPSFERVWGLPPEAIYRDRDVWAGALHAEDRDRVIDGNAEVLRRGTTFDQEYRIVRPDGSVRWIWDRAFPIRDDEGRVYRVAGIAEDVTERKRTEEALHRAERLASIGTLAAGIAHEINNPLGGIVLHADVARMGMDMPDGRPRVESSLDEIQAGAMRCGQIVKSVLQFARQEVSQKWAHDLIDVARRARDLTRKLADESGVSVALEGAEDAVRPVINPTEIEQVVVNLISNAIQASSPGGTVRVRIEPDTDCVRIFVEDEGRGMTDDQRRRVFDPFFTTRQPEGGTGLGMSITYGIIRQHGGSIDVDSLPGRGTTVTVVLPIGERTPHTIGRSTQALFQGGRS